MLNHSIGMLLPQIVGVLSILQLPDIITPQYSTAHILYNPACESFEPIVRTIQANFDVTTIIYRLDSEDTEIIFKHAHNYANLYIFLFASANHFRLIDGMMSSSLSTAATKMLFLLDDSAPVEEVDSLANVALAPLQRYVLFRSDGTVWLHYATLERFTLDPNDLAATRALLHRVHNLRVADVIPSGNVTVFIHYGPPRSLLVPLRDADENIEIIGTDSLMTYDIAKQLHVEPEICSDVAMFDVNFRGWFRKDYSAVYMNNNENHLFNTRMHRWRASHRFDVNATHGVADLYCTSALIDPTKILDENRTRDYLYPHSLECISVLVPVNKVRKSFLEILGHHSIVGPVGVVLALLAVVRVAGRRESAVEAVLLTYGSFLAQFNVPEPRRMSERLWLAMILVIALLASMVVSSAMYGIVMTVKYEAEIDTLEELIASGLTVYNVEFEDTFQNSRFDGLQKRRRQISAAEAGVQLMYGFNTSNAYVLSTTAAGYVLTLMNSVRQNDGPIFRIMKEPLECGLIAYQVPRASPLRAYVDNAIQAATEAGLYERYAVWAMQYFTSLYKALIPPDHSQAAVKWEGINGVFYIYFAGVVAATVAFGAEWLVWWLAKK